LVRVDVYVSLESADLLKVSSFWFVV